MPVAVRSAADNSKAAGVVSFVASGWGGNDGNWSVFPIGIGQEAQNFQALVALDEPNVAIPLTDYCLNLVTAAKECASSRGVQPFRGIGSYGFNVTRSSTWAAESPETKSGNDILMNGWQEGSAFLGFQNVDIVETSDPWIASLGLLAIFTDKHKSTYFPTNPVGTLIQDLFRNITIFSLSLGYTAGSSYRNLPASLVLGGYDSSKFISNNVTFSMKPNLQSPLTVNVTSIYMNIRSKQSSTQLLDRPIVATLKSSSPFLTLPKEACDQIESSFGLQFDATTSMYLVNDTMHSRILAMNSSIAITLNNGSTKSNGDGEVEILLPYAGFDLVARFPLYEKPTRYFPLRVAKNDSDISLGRVIFQESYAIIDYSEKNFSISKIATEAIGPPNIIPILFQVSEATPWWAFVLVGIFGLCAVCIIGFLSVDGTRRRNRRKRLQKIWRDAHSFGNEGYDDAFLYKLLGENPPKENTTIAENG